MTKEETFDEIVEATNGLAIAIADSAIASGDYKDCEAICSETFDRVGTSLASTLYSNFKDNPEFIKGMSAREVFLAGVKGKLALEIHKTIENLFDTEEDE